METQRAGVCSVLLVGMERGEGGGGKEQEKIEVEESKAEK